MTSFSLKNSLQLACVAGGQTDPARFAKRMFIYCSREVSLAVDLAAKPQEKRTLVPNFFAANTPVGQNLPSREQSPQLRQVTTTRACLACASDSQGDSHLVSQLLLTFV